MNNFQQTLKTSEKKESKSQKETMPVIEVKNQEVLDAIEGFIDAQFREKAAKADKECASDVIITYARKRQDEDGFNGKFSKSYKLKSSKDDDVVTYVTANKFSIDSDDEAKYENLFGKNFNSLMKKTWSVVLKPEIFEDEQKQKELIVLLGDKFNEFFDVYSKIVVQEDFDKNIYNAVKNDKKLSEVRVLVKQSKPSIR